MRFAKQDYARALFEALQDTKPADHDKIIDNFVAVLKQNGDLSAYAEIIEEFHTIELKSRGVKEVELVTATEKKVNKPILDTLNEIVGGKSEVTQKEDEDIIGGVVIRVDDTLIDGSLKSQLDDLESHLKGKE